jgi:NAD(P)-dependent dehydrogenase (short-subunit alcohol dehydrogenase family)
LDRSNKIDRQVTVREGARVVVTGRRPEPGEKVVAEFAEQGDAAWFVQADVVAEATTSRRPSTGPSASTRRRNG